MAPEDKIRKTRRDSMGYFNGKKSYLIAIATLVYAVLGVLCGHMSFDEAIKMVLASGALASLRHGLEKGQK